MIKYHILSQTLQKIHVPPIKTQGIKTKLVRFISDTIISERLWSGKGRWIEPFLGSGVVLFNILPKRALVSDVNPHIINLYKAIQNGTITADMVREFLTREGKNLEENTDWYYHVRDRFNDAIESIEHNKRAIDPLDFLFLNRAGFNGLIRFNSKGKFNTPFCKKPCRFSKSYITKITNQVQYIQDILQEVDWQFKVTDWQTVVKRTKSDDFIYLDPPYYGRHTNYYDTWDESDMAHLAKFLNNTKCRFALSLWYENTYRRNDDIAEYFSRFTIHKYEHFYHIGSTESLRNKMIEALITN